MAHRSNLAHCLFLYGKLMVFTLKWWGVGERNSKEEHTYDAQGRYEIQVSVCTNQVWLEHSQADTFLHHLWLLSHHNGRVALLRQRPHGLWGSKYLLSGCLPTRVPTPAAHQWSSRGVVQTSQGGFLESLWGLVREAGLEAGSRPSPKSRLVFSPDFLPKHLKLHSLLTSDLCTGSVWFPKKLRSFLITPNSSYFEGGCLRVPNLLFWRQAAPLAFRDFTGSEPLSAREQKLTFLPLSPSPPRDGKRTAREPTRTSNISAFPLPQDSAVDGFGWPSHTRVHNSVGFSLQPSLGCIKKKKKSETWREFLINWFEMLVTCKYLSACLRKNINYDQSTEASQYGLQGKDIHGHRLQWNLYLQGNDSGQMHSAGNQILSNAVLSWYKPLQNPLEPLCPVWTHSSDFTVSQGTTGWVFLVLSH